MIRSTIVTCHICLVLVLSASSLSAADDLSRRASWQAPPTQQVRTQLDQWLATRALSEEQRKDIEAIWITAEGEPLGENPTANLLRVVESAALAWPAAQEIIAETEHLKVGPVVKHFDILKHEEAEVPEAKTPDSEEVAEAAEEVEPVEIAEPAEENAKDTPSAEELNAWVVDNLRLHYARWLGQHELYDESLDLIKPVEAASVVDPASLLFYKSAAYHFLLNKAEGLATIDKLLENEEQVARRYTMTAKLMAADLKPLKADSLDEIARMMDDIERRLRLQRAGKRVRKEEDDVVAKLDKMIEELEKQQQQSSSSSSGGGSSNNPSAPMQDSQIGGASGEGNVDPKQLSNRENWGNLPAKERQEALQQITKELPAHYREAVEEYFRKLARDGVNP